MSSFNIRVYGLLINDKNEILLSDEQNEGLRFTKFPGGGLELGEGLIDALKREFIEECDVEIEVIRHVYTTDFYEKSIFNDSQVISIYYIVKSLKPLFLNFKSIPFDFDLGENQVFRWLNISKLSSDELTFKTDKTALNFLKSNFKPIINNK